MNIKRSRRIIFISILTFIVVLSSIGFVYATTSDELIKQQREINKQIDKKNEELNEVKEELSTTMTQIKQLNQEISNYQLEINNLQAQIDTLNVQITEKENNIKEQQEKYDAQKVALEKRLIAMYESGNMTYLDMLLSSNGIVDLISNYYLISEIAKADETLLDNIEKTKIQIENENNALKESKTKVEAAQTEIVDKKKSKDTLVSQKNALANNLTEEEKSIQAELEEFEKDKEKIASDLARIAAQEGVAPGTPSEAGYIMPLSGKTKSNITTGYGSYQTRSGRHTGVDFACSSGTPIYAVKAGTVVTSDALRYANGKYKSYGEYIVINHHDGTMTLYAHMLSNSRLVRAGDKVSQGQQIGQVGSTGNSTGSHLHFEVRVNGKDVNPVPYLP